MCFSAPVSFAASAFVAGAGALALRETRTVSERPFASVPLLFAMQQFVEGVLWVVRTGSPWRDLPADFGDWNSVFRRFSRWSAKGVWWRFFEALSDDTDFEYLIVDSTIVRAHQHAAGAKKGGLKIRPLAAPAAA